MEERKTIFEKIFCGWLNFHWLYGKWEHNGEHANCRICRRVIDKVDGRWVSWDRNPDNPASLTYKNLWDIIIWRKEV